MLSEAYEQFSEEERRHFARNIYHGSKSAFELLENLLEWSLIQLGQVDFNPEELMLHQFTEESFALLQLMAEGKNIALVNRVPAGQKIFADRHMFSAILRNLISNAIKFTPAGGSIEIDASTRNGKVEVTVSDNGMGMTAEVIDNLFSIENLHTRPGTENEKGTGLGLLLTKEFTERHKGNISASGEPGKGSRFIVALPEK